MVVEVLDIHDLMEKYFSDGFTMEGLSKTTEVPTSLLQKVRSNKNLTIKETTALNPVLYFLMQLYMCNTKDSAYLKDIVTATSAYFEIPPRAISKYLGLDEEQFKLFLNKPDQYENGYELTVKLLHLFTSFVRKKNY